MISAEQLAQYLGRGESSLDLAKKAIEIVRKEARENKVEAIAELERGQSTLRAKDMLISFDGDNIKALLDDCDKVWIVCVTIGNGIDRVIEELRLRDLTLAYAVDLCAGLWVDDYCEKLEQNMREKLKEQGKQLTQRFSCGYGDFPLQSQSQFVTALRADKYLGIKLTTGGMMIPSKSVSAVAGISDHLVKKLSRCAVCPKKDVCTGGMCRG